MEENNPTTIYIKGLFWVKKTVTTRVVNPDRIVK